MCRGVVIGALREYKVTGKSTSTNCVVEVIAQFLVLLVAFLALTEADLGGVTLHIIQSTDYRRQNVLERHRPKAKVSESIAQVSVDTFAVSKTCRSRRAC